MKEEQSDPYQEYTGNKKMTMNEFLAIYGPMLKAQAEAVMSSDEGVKKFKQTIILNIINSLKGVTEKEKHILIFKLATSAGEDQGIEKICNSCIAGPMSKLFHLVAPRMTRIGTDREDS